MYKNIGHHNFWELLNIFFVSTKKESQSSWMAFALLQSKTNFLIWQANHTLPDFIFRKIWWKLEAQMVSVTYVFS